MGALSSEPSYRIVASHPWAPSNGIDKVIVGSRGGAVGLNGGAVGSTGGALGSEGGAVSSDGGVVGSKVGS